MLHIINLLILKNNKLPQLYLDYIKTNLLIFINKFVLA